MMKPSLLLIVILIALNMGLTACVAAIPVPPSTPTILAAATEQPATSTKAPEPTDAWTPEPSPTPRPRYEINNSASWPQEMQDYFDRAPEEWNNPTTQYVSDEAFHQFIQQSRRDFLSDQGVSGIEILNEQELIMEYIRWGNENLNILILTPIEIRTMLSNPDNYFASYSEINDGNLTFHEGLFTYINLKADRDFQSLLNQLAEQQFSISVFGELINVSRDGYLGFVGDEAGLFRIPGINPEQGIGILGHWNPTPGQHAWIPLIVHFSPHLFHAGEIGMLNADVRQYPADVTMGPAHTGPLGNEGSLVTLQDLINSIRHKIQAMPDWDPSGNFSGNFPWQLGVEGAQRFEFGQSPLIFPPIDYPWH